MTTADLQRELVLVWYRRADATPLPSAYDREQPGCHDRRYAPTPQRCGARMTKMKREKTKKTEEKKKKKWKRWRRSLRHRSWCWFSRRIASDV